MSYTRAAAPERRPGLSVATVAAEMLPSTRLDDRPGGYGVRMVSLSELTDELPSLPSLPSLPTLSALPNLSSLPSLHEVAELASRLDPRPSARNRRRGPTMAQLVAIVLSIGALAVVATVIAKRRRSQSAPTAWARAGQQDGREAVAV